MSKRTENVKSQWLKRVVIEQQQPVPGFSGLDLGSGGWQPVDLEKVRS